MVRDISEMTEDEIMEELNMKYGIHSIEELNDIIMEIRNKLQPFMDFMVSWFDQFQKAMIEFRNSIPKEILEEFKQLEEDLNETGCIHVQTHIPKLGIYCDDCIADEERRNK